MSKITTYSGKLLDVLNPRQADICIEDIAFGLSRQYRFNGVTKIPYTVAQHSINVAAQVGENMRLAALLHDASEAYLHDIPTPIKENLPDYQDIEENLSIEIRRKFGIIQKTVSSAVNWADKQVLFAEIDQMTLHPELFGDKAGKSLWRVGVKCNFGFMDPDCAYEWFMQAYLRLTPITNV